MKLQQIEKRMWRGQVSMLLPAVDTIRLYICDRLTDNYGLDWPLSFPPKEPEELQRVKNNPRASQLGHLLHTIQYHRQFAEERKYIPLVKRAKEIRNELAHYRPINYTDYQMLAWEASKFGLNVFWINL
jgi:hypothetical protein